MFHQPCTVPIALYLREGLVTPAEVRWLGEPRERCHFTGENFSISRGTTDAVIMGSIQDQSSLIVGQEQDPLSPSTPPCSNGGSEAQLGVE